MGQLGSPHLRGSGQPKPPKLTWRDWLDGCAEIGCWLVSIPIAIAGLGLIVVGSYVGIDVFVAWVMGNDVLATLVAALMGALFVGIAVAGLFGIVRGRGRSGTSAARLVLAIAVLTLVGLMGVGILYGTFVDQSSAPTF